MASLALVLSVLAMGSVSPTLSSTDGHALSSAIFWAAIKALAYCQSPGSNDSKVGKEGLLRRQYRLPANVSLLLLCTRRCGLEQS